MRRAVVALWPSHYVCMGPAGEPYALPDVPYVSFEWMALAAAASKRSAAMPVSTSPVALSSARAPPTTRLPSRLLATRLAHRNRAPRKRRGALRRIIGPGRFRHWSGRGSRRLNLRGACTRPVLPARTNCSSDGTRAGLPMGPCVRVNYAPFARPLVRAALGLRPPAERRVRKCARSSVG